MFITFSVVEQKEVLYVGPLLFLRGFYFFNVDRSLSK